MKPSSHCRTSIFEEEFKFQYVSGDIHVHITTQNIILTFQSNTFPDKVNMEVFPNILDRNTFRATILFAWGVHRKFQR